MNEEYEGAALPQAWQSALEHWQDAHVAGGAEATVSLQAYDGLAETVLDGATSRGDAGTARTLVSDSLVRHRSLSTTSLQDHSALSEVGNFTIFESVETDVSLASQTSVAGVLHRGYQRSVQRPVHIVRSQADVVGSAERVHAEALLLGGLQHPCISSVYDVGVNELDETYYAVRTLEGVWWHELLADGGGVADMERHIRILLRVCDALAFTHKQQVVHGDIKPANVRIGRYGEVVVGGWHAAERGDAARQRIVSTVGYMAPEQAREDWKAIGYITDVYQLGGCLAHMLCGHAPHVRRRDDEEHDAPDDFVAVLRAAMLNVLYEPPAAVLASHADLWKIAVAAMHESVTQRTASVADFRAQIEAWSRAQEGQVLFVAAHDALVASDNGATMEVGVLRALLYQLENIYGRWPQLVIAQTSARIHQTFYQARLCYGRRAVAEGFIDSALAMLPVMAQACGEMTDEEQQLYASLSAAQQQLKVAQVDARRTAHIARWLMVLCGVVMVGCVWYAGASWMESHRYAQRMKASLATEQLAMQAVKTAGAQQTRMRVRGEISHAVAFLYGEKHLDAQRVLAHARTWTATWAWKRLLRRAHQQQSIGSTPALTSSHEDARFRVIHCAGESVYASLDAQHIGRFSLVDGSLQDRIRHDLETLDWVGSGDGQLYLAGTGGVAQWRIPSARTTATVPTSRALLLSDISVDRIVTGAFAPGQHTVCFMTHDGHFSVWDTQKKTRIYERTLFPEVDDTHGRLFVAGIAISDGMLWVVDKSGVMLRCPLLEKGAVKYVYHPKRGWIFGPIHADKTQTFMIWGYGNGSTGPYMVEGSRKYMPWVHIDTVFRGADISGNGRWWAIAARKGNRLVCRQTFERTEPLYFDTRSAVAALQLSDESRWVSAVDNNGWIVYALEAFEDTRVHPLGADACGVAAQYQCVDDGLVLRSAAGVDVVIPCTLAESRVDAQVTGIRADGWQMLAAAPQEVRVDARFSLRLAAGQRLDMVDTQGHAQRFENCALPTRGLILHPNGTLFLVGEQSIAVMPVRTASAAWWSVFGEHAPHAPHAQATPQSLKKIQQKERDL